MKYELVDHDIDAWAKRHCLKIIGRERNQRAVYLSSRSGECYQIWVGLPAGGQVQVNTVCIEGPREDDPEQAWLLSVDRIDDALDEAFRTVVQWMAPSERILLAPGPLKEEG